MNRVHITTNTTTTIGGTSGGNAQGVKLHTVAINTKGAASNTMTISDAAGTIAVIDTTAGPAYWVYDLDTTGPLTIVTATGTAPDATITYQ